MDSKAFAAHGPLFALVAGREWSISTEPRRFLSRVGTGRNSRIVEVPAYLDETALRIVMPEHIHPEVWRRTLDEIGKLIIPPVADGQPTVLSMRLFTDPRVDMVCPCCAQAIVRTSMFGQHVRGHGIDHLTGKPLHGRPEPGDEVPLDIDVHCAFCDREPYRRPWRMREHWSSVHGLTEPEITHGLILHSRAGLPVA